MAQLVASMSGVVLGGVVEVVGSNLARGKIFTASIGSVDSLYPSIYIYDFRLNSYGKMNNTRFSYINALGIKFSHAVKKVKVHPDSSFVHTW